MILKIIIFAMCFFIGLVLGWLILKLVDIFKANGERAYQAEFMSTDGNKKRTEWFYRRRTEDMRTVLVRALNRSKEIDMALLSFKRVDK